MKQTPSIYEDRTTDDREAREQEYVRCDNCFEYQARCFGVTIQNDNGTESHYCHGCAPSHTAECGDCLTVVHISDITVHDGSKFCPTCAAGIEE